MSSRPFACSAAPSPRCPAASGSPILRRCAGRPRTGWSGQAVFGGESEREAARWLLWELGQATGRGRRPSTTSTWRGAAASAVASPCRPSTCGCWPTTPPARSSGRPRPGRRGHHPRDRPLRDRLHRAAARRIRGGDDGGGAARGLHPPALHPGRPLPGQRQEVRGRSRGGGRRGQEADRRGDRRPGSTTSTSTPPRSSTSPSRRSTSSSALNFERCAEITAFIREREPEGVTVSVGGEIGEVGDKNSTVEELHAFMDGYTAALRRLGEAEGI